MDFNKPVIKYLQTFLDKEENAFKKKAYQTAIKNLSGVQINSIQDVIVIKGIGVKIREKIQYVIDNFDPETIDEPLDNIYGIGPAKLKQLKEKGINTFQKLKDALVLDSKLLNAKQKIGLQYYDDIETRIPYNEVVEHDKYLRKVILKNSKVETIDIVGSYRRKKLSSGDIDLLVKIKNKDDYIGILKELVEK